MKNDQPPRPGLAQDAQALGPFLDQDLGHVVAEDPDGGQALGPEPADHRLGLARDTAGPGCWAVSPSSTTSRFSAGSSAAKVRRVCGSCLSSRENRAWSSASAGCSTRRPARASSSDRRTRCSSPSSASWVRNSRPAPRISVRAPSPPRTSLLAAGLGLDDHLLHDVVEPGQLARVSRAGQQAHQDEGRQNRRGQAHTPATVSHPRRRSREEFIGSSPCGD